MTDRALRGVVALFAFYLTLTTIAALFVGAVVSLFMAAFAS